jgi:hypothetical protein
MVEMHADSSGVRFLAVERGETHRGLCSVVAAVVQRGTAWRASSGGGRDRRGARIEVRSTRSARGGIGGAVPWPEVPSDGGARMDTATALDTLLSTTASSTRRSRPVLEEGVAPAA